MFKYEKLICAASSVDRVPGYEPVGRRFESCAARQENKVHYLDLVFFVPVKDSKGKR